MIQTQEILTNTLRELGYEIEQTPRSDTNLMNFKPPNDNEAHKDGGKAIIPVKGGDNAIFVEVYQNGNENFCYMIDETVVEDNSITAKARRLIEQVFTSEEVTDDDNNKNNNNRFSSQDEVENSSGFRESLEKDIKTAIDEVKSS